MDWGLSFWISLSSRLKGVISFASWTKLSCNWTVTLVHPFQIFAAREKQGNCTHPQQSYHKGTTQWLSPCLSTGTVLFFPLNECFTCFTTFHLFGNSFLQSQRPGHLSLTTSLVVRMYRFHYQDPASIPGWIPAPFQAVAGRGHSRSYLKEQLKFNNLSFRKP